jgi:hypothetical protein
MLAGYRVARDLVGQGERTEKDAAATLEAHAARANHRQVGLDASAAGLTRG